MSTKLGQIAATLCLAVAGSSALAAIIPVPTTITPEGVDFRWSYEASIGTNLRVKPGDFFTIYDFGSLAGSPQMPAGWTYASANTGANPIFVAAADDPSIPNITFRYNGSSNLVGPLDLGSFSVLSESNLTTTADFAAQATHNGGTQDGQFVSNHGTIIVPLGIPEVITTVPEPTSSMVLAVGGVLLANRRRRASRA